MFILFPHKKRSKRCYFAEICAQRIYAYLKGMANNIMSVFIMKQTD